MHLKRRHWLTTAAAVLATACASQAPVRPGPAPASPEARAVLAPKGRLRVGVYPGSPTSLVTDAQGRRAGVAYEVGAAVGKWLAVPVDVVEYPRVAEVVEALRREEVDFTFTNALPARARLVSFGQPLVSVELGYLAPPAGKVRAVADIDRPGVRVGVTQGSSSQVTLGRQFQHAAIVPAASLEAAAEMLGQGTIDVFATNKAILNELADNVPGARILDGRWGLEHMAVAVPKGREAGLRQLDAFTQGLRHDGTLAAIIQRAGLRGTAP
ncbi:MAG: transporter substrate-binding domain-containing protein [Xenophilus sp.]